MIAVSEKGHYHPGQTLLHRLDPRVKILSCLLLVVLTFAAPGWPKLFPLIVTVALGRLLDHSSSGFDLARLLDVSLAFALYPVDAPAVVFRAHALGPELALP